MRPKKNSTAWRLNFLFAPEINSANRALIKKIPMDFHPRRINAKFIVRIFPRDNGLGLSLASTFR